jgi:hypothetical protein
MPPGNGWYLIGPLIAVGLVGLLGAVFWRMGLQWTVAREPAPAEDFGLLGPAAVAETPEIAEDIRRLLGDAGIRATQTVADDGRTTVLVFAEQLEEARQMVRLI